MTGEEDSRLDLVRDDAYRAGYAAGRKAGMKEAAEICGGYFHKKHSFISSDLESFACQQLSYAAQSIRDEAEKESQ